MSDRTISLLIQGVLALVLVIGMIWVIITPNVTDEATKAALVIMSSAAGFIFGRQTTHDT